MLARAEMRNLIPQLLSVIHPKGGADGDGKPL
jgi:hypothetical protein